MRSAKLTLFPILTLAMLWMYGCANMGRPSGGIVDETPPVLIKSTPGQNALRVKAQKIDLFFDENVTVERPGEAVSVSPPQHNLPEIRSFGKKVQIFLKDTLQPNTTYTIDFGNAIVDNNEKNPLYGFAFAFSTGEKIDTLQVSGTLLTADNLEPITGDIVGLIPDMGDSTFVKHPLLRISSTNALGEFTIRNVAPGRYRIFSLRDTNRDYMYDNATEEMAFLDSLIVPSVSNQLQVDTLWRDSLTIANITTHSVPTYFPNDVLLRAFNRKLKAQYLVKTERPEPRRFLLYFNTLATQLPELRPLSFQSDDWAIREHNLTNDTITYWIKDSLHFASDTLLFEAKYLRTDSTQQLTSFIDTLKLIYRQPKVTKSKPSSARHRSKKGVEVAPSIAYLPILANSGEIHPLSPLPFIIGEPIDTLPKKYIHLRYRVDSTWHNENFELVRDSLFPRRFFVLASWRPKTEYALSIDSLATTSIYGLHNKPFKMNITTRADETFASLFLNIKGVEGPAFVELLDKADNPIRRQAVQNGEADFLYVNPETYYLRLIVDSNNNQKWDTGDYLAQRQPETVYYAPSKIILRANWDIEQEWDVHSTPITLQKPKAITKNKPLEKKKEGESEEEEEEE